MIIGEDPNIVNFIHREVSFCWEPKILGFNINNHQNWIGGEAFNNLIDCQICLPQLWSAVIPTNDLFLGWIIWKRFQEVRSKAKG